MKKTILYLLILAILLNGCASFSVKYGTDSKKGCGYSITYENPDGSIDLDTTKEIEKGDVNGVNSYYILSLNPESFKLSEKAKESILDYKFSTTAILVSCLLMVTGMVLTFGSAMRMQGGAQTYEIITGLAFVSLDFFFIRGGMDLNDAKTNYISSIDEFNKACAENKQKLK
jgi:hypothetical protein